MSILNAILAPYATPLPLATLGVNTKSLTTDTRPGLVCDGVVPPALFKISIFSASVNFINEVLPLLASKTFSPPLLAPWNTSIPSAPLNISNNTSAVPLPVKTKYSESVWLAVRFCCS